LRSAEINHPQLLLRALGQIVKPEDGKFAALAGAFAQTGYFLYVPKDTVIEKPFTARFTATGQGSALITQIIVLMEAGSSATLFHEYASEDDSVKINIGSVELMVGENANLKFVEIQDWDNESWNFTHERAIVAADASLDWIIGALGSKLSKNFLDLDLAGEGATGKMSGFSFTNGNQHFDIDTQQNHRKARTESDLLFKGALNDNSRSVWQGMIYVAPGAEKTDGYQTSRNLVLSSSARADSIPGLEILADDVRCSHGATIGNIDMEQIYYLTSRGLSQKDAERLIIEGFFEPIMQRIPFDTIRERFQLEISKKIGS